LGVRKKRRETKKCRGQSKTEKEREKEKKGDVKGGREEEA
jgi:hypothetical protein